MRPHEPEPGHLYHLKRLRGNLVFVKVVILMYEFLLLTLIMTFFLRNWKS